MPARLLAYGGTSFSERRRIGVWPAVPEATLRDSYGLQANSWVYGMGVLARQAFLIFRQRQNVESRGGYPFSLLLDPGDAAWEKFEWNAAAIVSALLDLNPDQFFKNPETCSADALEAMVAKLEPPRITAIASGLSTLAAASAREPVVVSTSALGVSERPDSRNVAESLAALPICFRASAGWLIGGGGLHGRALGANLVITDQPGGDGAGSLEAGRRLLAAWEFARSRGLVTGYEPTPMWAWDQPPGDVLDDVLLLEQIATAPSIDEELLERAANAKIFAEQAQQLALDAVLRGSAPLGPRASALAIAQSLRTKRKLDSQTAARLDRPTLRRELLSLGSPPKAFPKQIAVPRELRVAMWVEYLEVLDSSVAKNLSDALKQLGQEITPSERKKLVDAAVAALPQSKEKLADWSRFEQDPETWALLERPLQQENQRRQQRAVVAPALIKKPEPRPEPEPEPAPDPTPEVLSLLFETAANAVEDRAESVFRAFKQYKASAEAVIARCDTDGEKFAASFAGKYIALGDAMSLVPPNAQERLIQALEEYQGVGFKAHVAVTLGHALKNRPSRNAYSSALARYTLQRPELLKVVALRMVEDEKDLKAKLKAMLK